MSKISLNREPKHLFFFFEKNIFGVVGLSVTSFLPRSVCLELKFVRIPNFRRPLIGIRNKWSLIPIKLAFIDNDS
jgi:hypothetical protein